MLGLKLLKQVKISMPRTNLIVMLGIVWGLWVANYSTIEDPNILEILVALGYIGYLIYFELLNRDIP